MLGCFADPWGCASFDRNRKGIPVEYKLFADNPQLTTEALLPGDGLLEMPIDLAAAIFTQVEWVGPYGSA